MSTMPELARPMAVKLFELARHFRDGRLPRGGLVVCFEGRAVGWVPTLEHARVFATGAFAVDEDAACIYIRSAGRKGWDVVYAKGDA